MSSAHFIVGDACNNGCRGCIWSRRLDVLTPATIPPPEDVRGRGVRLAGREPTVRPDLVDLVRGMRAAGAVAVELETNGRMLSQPRYAQSILEAGVSRLAVKLFGRDAAAWDAHTRVPGSYAQTIRGIQVVRRLAPRLDLVAVLIPRRDPAAGLDDLLALTRELGFSQARVELRLAKLDLGALPRLAAEVRALRQNPPAGLRVDVATG